MTKEQKFYKALQDVFIGVKIEGKGGFVNLMRIKSNYYRKIEDILKKDIEATLKSHPEFRDELFDKLYSFFSRYFTESGSIYFNSTPFHNNIYEKVYTDKKDVILFWKTQMLYYVKTDRLFRSLPVEFDGFKLSFDASKIENKKANEKRSLVFELNKVREDGTIVFDIQYSARGAKTKQDELLKAIKRKGLAITEEQLERAFRVFEKQSEVDFFINKNAKAFLQEQFKLWSYQYFWEGAKEWGADRVNQLQILKDIAFKIIDFISQFEDELVKIWNKPKFVKNSNYVITLDRITDPEGKQASYGAGKRLVEKILNHDGFKQQIKEWQELGIVDENFTVEKVFNNSPLQKGWHPEGMTGYSNLPYNPKLKERARELRKTGNLSEVLLWNYLKQKKMLGFDFTRQQVIGNYIVDFHCPKLRLVIEIDGEGHDFKGEYDEERDKFLNSLGLTVLHFNDLDVKKSITNVVESIKSWIENTPSASRTPLLEKGELNSKYQHLPIDTKYFKDLELEILGLFDDLDKSLDGWLIKSENYQALNTILLKFKEQVQTIYIDPPFNLEKNADYPYIVNYKDSSWATLLENRLRIAKEWLNKHGNIFVRCDYNGNWIIRPIMDETFENNFQNEIILNRFKKESGVLTTTTESLFLYSKSDHIKFHKIKKSRECIYCKQEIKSEWQWAHSAGESNVPKYFKVDGKPVLLYPPRGRHWTNSKETIYELEKQGRIRINKNTSYIDTQGNRINFIPEKLQAPDTDVDSNWTDIPGYEFGVFSAEKFSTQNSEELLERVILSGSDEDDFVFDFFLGSGTTTALAHALSRKWLGVEMAEHFYTKVLPRMKRVLANVKNEILDTITDYEGGGFFKYYELEQYEETLANCKYEDGDLFNSPLQKGWHSEGMTGYLPGRTPYQEYVFMKDEKMLKALEIDYEKNKVEVDLTRLYPSIDIAETLSNLTGKWIKKIIDGEIEFADGTKINTRDLDYKVIKSLIWW